MFHASRLDSILENGHLVYSNEDEDQFESFTMREFSIINFKTLEFNAFRDICLKNSVKMGTEVSNPVTMKIFVVNLPKFLGQLLLLSSG